MIFLNWSISCVLTLHLWFTFIYDWMYCVFNTNWDLNLGFQMHTNKSDIIPAHRFCGFQYLADHSISSAELPRNSQSFRIQQCLWCDNVMWKQVKFLRHSWLIPLLLTRANLPKIVHFYAGAHSVPTSQRLSSAFPSWLLQWPSVCLAERKEHEM